MTYFLRVDPPAAARLVGEDWSRSSERACPGMLSDAVRHYWSPQLESVAWTIGAWKWPVSRRFCWDGLTQAVWKATFGAVWKSGAPNGRAARASWNLIPWKRMSRT